MIKLFFIKNIHSVKQSELQGGQVKTPYVINSEIW